VIVDTSALIAVLRDEPEADRFGEAMGRATPPRVSAVTYVEAAVVVDSNRDPVLSGRFDDLLSVAQVKVEPVTQGQAEIARRAYRDFGKGSGHPAGLNFGDCFAYALARESGESLLFKGNDFDQTDVTPVL